MNTNDNPYTNSYGNTDATILLKIKKPNNTTYNLHK